MEAAFDALGNVVGRYARRGPGRADRDDAARTWTACVNAGSYDGVFGILTAIACVRDLHARGKRLPFTFEVVAFGDEEGVRFGVTLIGSKAMGGSFDPALLDSEGRRRHRAARGAGGVRRRPGRAGVARARPGKRVVAYVESHIEQGPVLLNEGLPVGVVTAIAGGIARARRASRASPATPAPCRWPRGATRSPPRPRWCSRSSASCPERRRHASSAPWARCGARRRARST